MRPQACNEKQLGCEAPFHELIDAEYRVVYRDADHLAEDELLSGEFHLHRFGQCLEFSHEPAIWLESNHVRGRAVNGLTHGASLFWPALRGCSNHSAAFRISP